MSQTQQTLIPPKDLSSEEPPALPMEPEVGSWEPYLNLMKNWQRADEICAKAVERSEATRQEEEKRARSTFDSDKEKIESTGRERVNAIEVERQAARDNVDRLLTQTSAAQTRVRQAMGTVGLEALMDNIDLESTSQRGDAATTLASLRDTVTISNALEDSLQDELFDLRAARQRQSAQLWAVGVGLWIVAVLVFAPSSFLSALLVAIAAFVMATPRKIGPGEALRPSFAAHLGHCVALLFGKQQVMQYPFSIFGKGGVISSNAFGGALATACVAWLIFLMFGSPMGYGLVEMFQHLGLVSIVSIFAGLVTFAVANNDVTLTELSEGSTNKILK